MKHKYYLLNIAHIQSYTYNISNSKMILTTRDLILNGTRAYITFNTELDNSNGLVWSLSLVDQIGNCSSTTGYITLDAPKPVTTETKPVATETKPVATETKPVATETKPVATETKPVVSETKPVATETKPVATETNPVTTETKPVATETKPVASETKPITTETKPVASETKPITTETKPITTKEDLVHCTNIKKFLIEVETSASFKNKRDSCVKLLNYISNNALEFVNKYPKFKETTIDKCWEIKTTNWDNTELCNACDNLLNTLNVSEIPPSYIDTYGRLILFRKIFDERNLILTRQLWNKYNEWSKTVKGLNRYKKMIEFIGANKENIQVKA